MFHKAFETDINYISLIIIYLNELGWKRVGTAFPHLFWMWERVPTPFCTRNVTWRFRFFISISIRSAWSSI